jgi:hypothetical protein
MDRSEVARPRAARNPHYSKQFSNGKADSDNVDPGNCGSYFEYRYSATHLPTSIQFRGPRITRESG